MGLNVPTPENRQGVYGHLSVIMLSMLLFLVILLRDMKIGLSKGILVGWSPGEIF